MLCDEAGTSFNFVAVSVLLGLAESLDYGISEFEAW